MLLLSLTFRNRAENNLVVFAIQKDFLINFELFNQLDSFNFRSNCSSKTNIFYSLHLCYYKSECKTA